MVKLYSIIDENLTKDEISEALGSARLVVSGTKSEQLKRLLKHTERDPRRTLQLLSSDAIATLASNFELRGRGKSERIEKLITSLFPKALDPKDQPSLPDEPNGIVEIPNALVYRSFTEKYDVAVVDFSASWCGPCKLMHKMLEELATEMRGKVAIGQVDVDLNQELSDQNRISGVPTVMIFKNGERVDRFSGVDPNLKQRIDRALG